MVRIYNSMAREVQDFAPITPGKVGMYVCGMTVYDFCHLGHARVMVVFDAVYRWLVASGFDVTYVRNITDIDDKIIRRAAENGESIRSLTDRFIQAMNEDSERLGVLRPTFEPRATDYISQMQDIICQLEARGIAYRAADGDVNFSVRKFPGYGRLSGKSIDDLRAGERVQVADSKQDPLDFVLWKHAREDESDEVKWDSPWGKGRPGWHIECSAMSSDLLGRHFDIHGGGHDLQFPHHENEIAQSEGAHGSTFVNYWMHNGFVRVDDEKMSKSLGNFFTIRDVLNQYDAEVVRFFILRAHYRSALNYSDAHLTDARHSLDSLYFALRDVPPCPQSAMDWSSRWAVPFKAAMDEDFDTHGAVSVLFEMAREIQRTRSSALSAELKALGGVLGLLQRDPEAYLRATPGEENGLTDEQIEGKILERQQAKAARNFTRSDEIRDELREAGIILEDSAGGTRWRRG